MTNPNHLTHLSKFLSLILRHQPQTIGLQLDPNGWAGVDELIQKAAHYGVQFDRATLNHIVATNAKKRFAFDDTGDKIRASQGHSVAIELGYRAQQPPAILYHGTSEKAMPSISANGIEKRSRQHVHLSRDLETAIKVGQRHGKPFVFEILAAEMHKDGFPFFLSDNGVWLTDHVPAKYLKKNNE